MSGGTDHCVLGPRNIETFLKTQDISLIDGSQTGAEFVLIKMFKGYSKSIKKGQTCQQIQFLLQRRWTSEL